jgi:hypothetical protein
MPEVIYKTPSGLTVGCEILNRFSDTYQIVYHDPRTNARVISWVHKTSLFFPQYSELIV